MRNLQLKDIGIGLTVISLRSKFIARKVDDIPSETIAVTQQTHQRKLQRKLGERKMCSKSTGA